MYLTALKLNLESRSACRDISDCHQMHRTVMKCFPDFQTNEKTRAQGSVLWRMDLLSKSNRFQILIQSEIQPDFRELPTDYLDDSPTSKKIDWIKEKFQKGARFRFRLQGNTTKRRLKADPNFPESEKWIGKRVPLYSDKEKYEWISRKANQSGFKIMQMKIQPEQESYLTTNVRIGGTQDTVGFRSKKKITFCTTLFEGVLEIEDSELFFHAFTSGIGPAKAYGFGMLSLAPL